jgi:hypothetical protein
LSQHLVLRRTTNISRENFDVKEDGMFLATKLNLLSGMIIGASAVLLMKEMCKSRYRHKQKQEHQRGSHSTEPEQETVA